MESAPDKTTAIIKALIDVAREFNRVTDSLGKSCMSSPFYDVAMMIVQDAKNYVSGTKPGLDA